jgi:hypothetical protein
MRLSAGLAFLLLVLAMPARAQDPRFPAGKDPGGTAIVLLTRGIDYTRPEIASLLARDGEGELIGWDFVDNDNRPFVKGDNTMADVALAQALGAAGGVRIVPVRINPGDSVSLARGIVFAARSPARVVVVPFSSGERDHWETFAASVRHLPNLMVIVPATDATGTAQSFPGALELPNAVVVANRKGVDGVKSDVVIERATPEEAVIAAVATAFGCQKLVLEDSKDGAAAKADFVKALADAAAAGGSAQSQGCPASQSNGEKH